ncbi:hypothetical protein [Micromonospora sp. KC207]|uniref:hypothetical protein n=1 Tax=Micromonospora sp. KC207 TaxID=2530377 RepID=UPI00352C3891
MRCLRRSGGAQPVGGTVPRSETGQWSQHTVTVVLTNRIYLGEKRFRDILVQNAHEARSSAWSSSTSHNASSGNGQPRSANGLPTPPTTP